MAKRNHMCYCQIVLLAAVSAASALHFEQRNEVSYLRGKYNNAFFHRHNDSFRYSAAFHYYHSKQHDVLLLTPLKRHHVEDIQFDGDIVAFTYGKEARTEPTMDLFAPYMVQMAWKVVRAIDWTHMHHEQTYDILSERGISWDKKGEWTHRSVRYYLEKNPIARSCAPLDVTMRRAGVMMKPYFGYYRNYYPRSSKFAYVAHWWHPAVYECMMIAGNDEEQKAALADMNRLMLERVTIDRPTRMLLSREMMPRYSRLSPESANIFDNLHMLHGIVYDIMAYEGWNNEQKRAELYRVIDAMSYQPGDEKLAQKFDLPNPDMDPRIYEDWMKGYEGSMTRIMEEMWQEMMPLMMPDGMPEAAHSEMMAQFRMKLSPGMEPGEMTGSLGDAMRHMMPDMKMDPASMAPGATPVKMIQAMLAGWERKYGDLPDVENISMEQEPVLPRQGKERP